MTKKWNPNAKPPKPETGVEFLRWFIDDLSLFQQERPDLAQGAISSLRARDKNRIIRAWNSAREEAELEEAKKVSPEWHRAVKRFQRTRTISFTAPRPKKTKAR